MREASNKSKDWGKSCWRVVDDEVLCFAWVDNNCVQFMTTAYNPEELGQNPHFFDAKKRKDIPESAVIEAPHRQCLTSTHAHTITVATAGYRPSKETERYVSWTEALPQPGVIRGYNQNMGGSDINAQLRAAYINDRKNLRWPQKVFGHVIQASVVNSIILHEHAHKKRPDHQRFIEEVCEDLIRPTIAVPEARKTPPKIAVAPDPIPSLSKHTLIPRAAIAEGRHTSKAYCVPCREEGSRKRAAMEPISGNAKRQRPPQTKFECSVCHKACCWSSECFGRMHPRLAGSFELDRP